MESGKISTAFTFIHNFSKGVSSKTYHTFPLYHAAQIDDGT